MKQVIIIRKDLKMGAGKVAAQVAHASIGCLLGDDIVKKGNFIGFDENVIKWFSMGQKKVCLRVESEEELLNIEKIVKNETGLPYSLIEDSGKTEFNGVSTLTCIGIGPGSEEEIDKITSNLKLY